MTVPPALEVLYEASSGQEVPLPPALRSVYGRLLMPLHESRPYVISNYVQSIDGVVTLDSGRSAGGPISGGNEHDRMIMGLLRSLADAVIVGAGTLRSVPRHIWT
ncbi:MAG: dihydrofolate reductase family protein, partial [Acidimicrobiia bacterium]